MPTTDGYNGAYTGAQIDEAIGQVRGKNLPADGVKFTDGETFQQKYDAGELTGPQGAQGPAGADGEDGGYYKPAVDASGNLTWTASKSGMPAVSGQNIRGPQGEQGPQGPAGADGQDGAQGPRGEQGPAGADGAQGEQGPQGPAGADGKDGAAATITVGTVTTGEPGTSATVTNSGTSSAAVFNFTIPRGAKGDKGDKGDTGGQGPAGAAGANGKSAYEYAQDAGYTGTEADLSAALASLGDLNSILDTINGEVI